MPSVSYTYDFTGNGQTLWYGFACPANQTIQLDNIRLTKVVDHGYEAVVVRTADYYPFGMIMPGRNKEYAEGKYRFGYNGMEKDDEVSGNGNSYTTEFRQYDPRLGRWKSLDPLMAEYPWMSPYVAFNDNPIFFTDPLGLEGKPVTELLTMPTVESTPSGGSVTLPAGAVIIGRYNESGYYSQVYGDKNKGEFYNHYAQAGSVRAFEYRGISYQATYNIETGDFIGYSDANDFSQSGLTNKKPVISFSGGPIITSQHWGTDTENGMKQAAAMGGALAGNPLGKTPPGVIAAIAMTGMTAVLGSKILYTETWDFALTDNPPVAIPKEEINKPPIIMYHYTDEKGMLGILLSQYIWPSLKANNLNDARYGDGVYWSDIIPGSKNPAQLARIFINFPNPKKYTHFIAIDVSGVNIEYGRPHVYVTPTSTGVPIGGRLIGSGPVPSIIK